MKIAIIGLGHVGSTSAYTVLLRGIADVISLFDVDEKKVQGCLYDLEHASIVLGRKTIIKAGKYQELKDYDFIIVTAGTKPNNTSSRSAGMYTAYNIVSSIATEVKKSGFKGYAIILSNPLDVMTYTFYKFSGLDRNHVIGTGTLLDNARYISILSKKLDVSPNNIEGYVIGEHGELSTILFSSTKIGNIFLEDYLKENHIDVLSFEKEVTDEVISIGFTIVQLQGYTHYGVASSACDIVEKIIEDKFISLPVSIIVDDIAISKVVSLNNSFITEDKIALSLKEKEIFVEAEKKIREQILLLGGLHG